MSVYLGKWQDQTIHLSLTPSRLSLTLEGSGNTQVYNYDYEGRPWNLFFEEVTYQRGLDGAIVAKWINPQTGRGRRWLRTAEARALEDRASGTAQELWEALAAGNAQFSAELPPGLDEPLQKAASFAGSRAATDIASYFQIYKPIGILPPDQYLSVVLQATEGCSFNTCSFCSFYKDRPFRIKSPESFRQHAEAVSSYLGAGLSLRRTIFLGDANALVVPTERLLVFMNTAAQVFDVEKLGGFYAFLDGFSGERKTVVDYQALRDRGLERVYIGLESGHDPLLRYLHKPSRAKEALEAVRKLKSAGVSVGVIVLLGAGGVKFARGHIRDTIRILNTMPLDLHDQIYFSELIEEEGREYFSEAFQEEIQPLSSAERLEQGTQIERELRFNPQRGEPHIARYDIREFVY